MRERVIPALRFRALTRFYDPVPAGILRESTWKAQLVAPNGELHIADRGRPHDALMRAAFLPVQLLDGFATTADNVRGALPALVAAAGFDSVRETRRRRTVFGTLTFLLAQAGGAP